jgi:hypothetical protein
MPRLIPRPSGYRRCPVKTGCSSLPVAVAIAVALVAPLRAALAVSGAVQRFALQLHRPLGSKADHLAQKRVSEPFSRSLRRGDLVACHRGDPQVRVACRNPNLLRTATVAANRPACAKRLAGALAGRLAVSYTMTRDTIQSPIPSARLRAGFLLAPDDNPLSAQTVARVSATEYKKRLSHSVGKRDRSMPAWEIRKRIADCQTCASHKKDGPASRIPVPCSLLYSNFKSSRTL